MRWRTRSDGRQKVNARTSGIYVRATAADLKTLDGSDTAQRAKLIADRLSHWKEMIST